ncbi:proteic killer suppression protein [Lentzea albidocapillata subsp. violacea]|uniref:Proteic killer suppression protein n=1 Tax=Lentzea albidocapillata subsp. violacea TaxID=128104 RepID=A0A1G9XXU4_9PSEU|nr:type II toxin-antitoxin system RelE/ParE family toxin [Lentzea albidocapillata]SDN01083.1 proteic killer suppression protein [Lentzea albidocapillata subsp. violacea]
MHVRYGDEMLHRLAADAAFQPDTWDPDVIRAYRRRLQSLRAANDSKDLQRVMSLDLRTENGRGQAHSSIRLANGARLLLEFDAVKTDEVTVMVIVESDTREVTP